MIKNIHQGAEEGRGKKPASPLSFAIPEQFKINRGRHARTY
jgi:hypothetical protein